MKNGWNDLQEQLWRLVHRWESVPGRVRQAACIKSVRKAFSTHSHKHTQVVDALFRARSWTELRQTRVRLLEKIPSPSPPTLRHLPAEPSSCPLAIKPFPNNVGSSVTKTAPANIVRTPSTMAVLILLGELSPTCSVIKIPDGGISGSSRKVSVTVIFLHGRMEESN